MQKKTILTIIFMSFNVVYTADSTRERRLIESFAQYHSTLPKTLHDASTSRSFSEQDVEKHAQLMKWVREQNLTTTVFFTLSPTNVPSRIRPLLNNEIYRSAQRAYEKNPQYSAQLAAQMERDFELARTLDQIDQQPTTLDNLAERIVRARTVVPAVNDLRARLAAARKNARAKGHN